MSNQRYYTVPDAWVLVSQSQNLPIPPMDENPGSKDYGAMLYQSQEAAEAAAKYQRECYGTDAIAVRLMIARPQDPQDMRQRERQRFVSDLMNASEKADLIPWPDEHPGMATMNEIEFIELRMKM